MDLIDLARWQFGITTVYHFLLVPITIGLSAMVAAHQRRGCAPGTSRGSGSRASSASSS